MCESFRGHSLVVKTLVELGANTELIDANGWTPQDIAKACGHESIASFLRLKQKKQPASAPLKGNTPAKSAASQQARPALFSARCARMPA